MWWQSGMAHLQSEGAGSWVARGMRVVARACVWGWMGGWQADTGQPVPHTPSSRK